jgi:hypothetical protein
VETQGETSIANEGKRRKGKEQIAVYHLGDGKGYRETQ